MIQNQRTTGNALIEYVLPLGILGTAVILAFSGGPILEGIRNYFQHGVKGTVSHNVLQVSPLGQLPPGSAPSARPGGSQSDALSDTSSGEMSVTDKTSKNPIEEKVCLHSGVCVNIPVITGGKTVSETVGSLGGNLTVSLAKVFDQVSSQLQARKAHPALTNLVSNLAAEGRTLGEHLNQVQQQCPINASCRDNLQQSLGTQAYADGFKETPVTQSNLGTGGSLGISGGTDNGASVSLDTHNFQHAHQALQDYFSANPGQFSDISGLMKTEFSQMMNIVQGLSLNMNSAGTVSTPPVNQANLSTQNASTCQQ